LIVVSTIAYSYIAIILVVALIYRGEYTSQLQMAGFDRGKHV